VLGMLTDTLRADATEPTGATTSNIAHINARLRSKLGRTNAMCIPDER
jgi:hypothetical protein